MPEADTRPTSGYLRNGLMWQQRATAEGIPLKGNFVWVRWTTSTKSVYPDVPSARVHARAWERVAEISWIRFWHPSTFINWEWAERPDRILMVYLRHAQGFWLAPYRFRPSRQGTRFSTRNRQTSSPYPPPHPPSIRS